MNYQDFLKTKIKFNKEYGFKISQDEINPILKPHQKDIVQWGVQGGRRAIFASFGLGKTFIQIEILRLISKKKSGKHLVVAPLGVRQEFTRDADKLGVKIKFVRWDADCEEDGFYITNYESIRDGRLSADQFTSVTLDEASVLRSYGSETYQKYLTLFDDVKFRFVATATPSPNRYKELIHYAGFLGVMDTGQALTRFFKRDSTKANNLTLYPHMEAQFWSWIHSWGIFLQKPSDLGYSDDGYLLPDLDVNYHEITAKMEISSDRDGQYGMFNDAALSLKDAAREKRCSIDNRIKKALEIIKASPDDHFIIWHDLESERHAFKKALPETVEVYGSLDLETREDRIIKFSDGEFKYLATKPILSGSGCNFQRHCHRSIFLGVGYKFNDFIQAVHRIHRFLQKHQCVIDIIHTDTERLIVKELNAKWKRHKEMTATMTDIIKKHGLNNTKLQDQLTRSMGVERIEVMGEYFKAINNDCVDETKAMDENSIDLIHTSIPFSNHYEYTPSYNDFGHTSGDDQFFEQMDHLTPQLHRILKPGRVAAIHVKDRINFGNVTGYGMPTVNPFHMMTTFHYIKHGFKYMGMITVVTDVVRENNQTYRLGWTEQCKDGSKMGVGSPEYILLFRKLPTDTTKAYSDEKVEKSKEDYSRSRWQIDAHAFWRSSGNRQLSTDELAGLTPEQLSKTYKKHSLETIYNYEQHVSIGEKLDAKGRLPSTFMTLAPGSHSNDVWDDVNRMRTLNGEQTRRGLNNHICPLQFDIVDRIIRRYSNKGETIFDPFGGLMTVPYCAVKQKRKGIGIELNSDYFYDGVQYLSAADREMSMPDMFEVLDVA